MGAHVVATNGGRVEVPNRPGTIDPAGVEEHGVHTGVPQELVRSDRLRDPRERFPEVYRITNSWLVVWCCGPKRANQRSTNRGTLTRT